MKTNRIMMMGVLMVLTSLATLYAQTAQGTAVQGDEVKTSKKATLNSNPRQVPHTTYSTTRTAPKGAGAGAFAVGDTIVITHAYTRYMTGERIAPWVYEGKYTVIQVDSKYHPGGILVSDINSWIDPDTVERIEQKPDEVQPTTTPNSKAEEVSAEEPVPAQPADTATPAVAEEPQPETPAQPAPVEEPAAPAVVEEPQPETPTQPAMPEEVAEPAADTPQPESTIADEAATTEEPAEHVAAKDNGTHRFTIGLRGGYANNLSKAADAKHPFGYDAMLDLQYAHYWAKSADQCRLGLLVGVGIGYLQSGLQQSLNEQFTANTSDGDIRYTITADEVKDKVGQLQLEVPVMFSMITPGGFFLNAGPKVLLPVYTPSHQTITNPTVDAFFEEEGVHVVNEAVTGVVTDAQQDLKSSAANNLKVNILLGVELGYEFRLQSGYSIGLGAYANYGLWNAYKGTGDGSVFSLTAPEGAANATIDISTLTNAKATKIGYVDAGVKLTFNFDFRR